MNWIRKVVSKSIKRQEVKAILALIALNKCVVAHYHLIARIASVNGRTAFYCLNKLRETLLAQDSVDQSMYSSNAPKIVII